MLDHLSRGRILLQTRASAVGTIAQCLLFWMTNLTAGCYEFRTDRSARFVVEAEYPEINWFRESKQLIEKRGNDGGQGGS